MSFYHSRMILSSPLRPICTPAQKKKRKTYGMHKKRRGGSFPRAVMPQFFSFIIPLRLIAQISASTEETTMSVCNPAPHEITPLAVQISI